MNQYTAFWLDDYDNPSPPIATGSSRGDALALAIQRVLLQGIISGSIGVQEQNNISADEFKELTRVLDETFQSIGEKPCVT